MIRNIALLPLAVLAIACLPVAEADTAQTPAANEVAMPESDPREAMLKSCDAGPVQNLVGQRHTEAMAKDAMARIGARTMRLIRPGMAVTMDYRTDRLNIEVDEAGVITAIRCG